MGKRKKCRNFGTWKKLAIANRFLFHILHYNMTHFAIIKRRANKIFKKLLGEWKRTESICEVENTCIQ